MCSGNNQKSVAVKADEKTHKVSPSEEWHLVNRGIQTHAEDQSRHQANTFFDVPLLNRFSSLEVMTPDLENGNCTDSNMHILGEESLDTKVSSSMNQVCTPQRRPGVVVQLNPERNTPPINRRPKPVPGHSSYSRAHIRNIRIVSDSTARSVNAKRATKEMLAFGLQSVRCHTQKFPGATTNNNNNNKWYLFRKRYTHSKKVTQVAKANDGTSSPQVA